MVSLCLSRKDCHSDRNDYLTWLIIYALNFVMADDLFSSDPGANFPLASSLAPNPE